MAKETPAPFGEIFLKARKARGKTLSDVFAVTKIAVSHLEAIERDEFENLPHGVFLRGFVRSYAMAVGLDPKETLEKFEARFPEQSIDAVVDATTEGLARGVAAGRKRMLTRVLGVALVLAGLVAWLMSGSLRDDGGQPAQPVRSEALSGDAARPGVPGAGLAPDETPPGDVPPAGDAGAGSPPPASSAPAASAGNADPPPAAPAVAERLTLEIAPTRDCWVEATVDGATVITRVMTAADREVVVAEASIVLRIGDAAAFAFTLNERPGRTLGPSGAVVNVQITPSNYRSFLAE